MSTTSIETTTQPRKTRMNPELASIIRDFVRHHAQRRGRQRTAEAFGVSRQTLWRYLEYGHMSLSQITMGCWVTDY